VTDIPAKITYEDIMNDSALSNSNFALKNMRGRNEVTAEYQKALYDLIIKKNPKFEEKLLGIIPR
jgi:hypothetical protein